MSGTGLHAPTSVASPEGAFVCLDGEDYYRISAFHRLPPFFMSLASDTDLWMFVSSRGGLTAGRVDADGSLFPYETVDKLHDAHAHTGPLTMLRVRRGDSREVLWQPFSTEGGSDPGVERNIYKNTLGNRLVFEEIHRDLQLSFRYRWATSEEFGLVRTAWLENLASEPATVTLLDGLRNVLPHGAPLALHQGASCLVDAYKRTEIDADSGLGIFSLTAKILDRPEAAEELRANTVWCHGLHDASVHPDGDAVAAFREGRAVPDGRLLTGRRGNYLLCTGLRLAAGAATKWHIVADVGRSHVQLAALRDRLQRRGDLDGEIERSLERASDNLRAIIGSADGLQLTGHAETTVHHLTSVLFNCMRGGVCANGYAVPAADLAEFLLTRNRSVAGRHAGFLASLPEGIELQSLLLAAETTGDPDLLRLCHEYLPIFFSRRHGDPSRPWNRFSIRVRNRDGTRALHYEGNWRDIFQNWEALALSFPALLPNFIAKFVNASTVDGFNPYRIGRDGIDWEVIDPRNPWSNIGYWGDHQIVYLLRFLEALRRFHPGALESLLDRRIFSYADVPYRIKPFGAILQDPRSTIEFDRQQAARIEERVEIVGTDGKLLPARDGSVLHVNLLEKLLVPALGKLSNFVPDGGIWMNTQRPEWNDANNALAGNGVSMVTLYHLRRYLLFLKEVLETWEVDTTGISMEVVKWFESVDKILRESRPSSAADPLSDRDRLRLMTDLGEAFSAYRERVYSTGVSGETPLPVVRVVSFCGVAVEHLDRAIRRNRREDGLYHAYNVLRIDTGGGTAALSRLGEMLEGQVALLDSGSLGPTEAVDLLDSLFASRLYDPARRSFLLYPEKELPGFLETNVLPEDRVRAVPLLCALLETAETSLVSRDVYGICRFSPDLRNAEALGAALDRLAEQANWDEAVSRDRGNVLELFEDVFHHRSFTGRSGTMYGYEGIGCIYWHMVAKLLLAIQGVALEAVRTEEPSPVRDALAHAYFRTRAGLGFEKTVSEFGAFPTDPYSHTPSHGGARQPGMTGQVKEEILARFGELGLRVAHGEISFRPVLLQRREFRSKTGVYRYFDPAGSPQALEVPADALVFSFCQVPIMYRLAGGESWIRTTTVDGATTTDSGTGLDRETSRMIFERTGRIARIDVGIPRAWLSSADPNEAT